MQLEVIIRQVIYTPEKGARLCECVVCRGRAGVNPAGRAKIVQRMLTAIDEDLKLRPTDEELF